MGAIDYHGIKVAIKEMLEDDADLNAPLPLNVFVEPDMQFAAEETPWVGIYAENRNAADSDQPLGAAQIVRYTHTLKLIVAFLGFDSLAETTRIRDDVLGRIEIALMKDRTLKGTVVTSWPIGGEMGFAINEGSFMAVAELMLNADVCATTQ